MRISYFFSQGESVNDYIKKANESFKKFNIKINNFDKLQKILSLYDYQTKLEKTKYFYFKDNIIMLQKK